MTALCLDTFIYSHRIDIIYAVSHQNKGIISNQNEWSNLGFVDGNGTTTKHQFYSYKDNNIADGEYQY
ncbi:MAG: hypothetical protein MUO21_08055, partial [Nitrososphaeraceae archaeon]|nr:hypothetical protein [Nitrososphaeraceae archaeon]